MPRKRLLLTLALSASALTAQVSYSSASLDGGQEVPPNNSTASGWGVVRFDAATNAVGIFVHTDGVTASAAHLHLAPVGANGPVIVPLAAAGSGDWTGTATLSAAQANALNNAGTYINVHSAAFPGGEIRGQVVAPRSTRITAALSGGQEVPPNNSTATGAAICFLHEPDNRLVYVVTTQGLNNVTAAHIHTAPAGANGPVLQPLTGSAGDYCGVTPKLTAAQVGTLTTAGMYVNVHTQAFPGGEIRGQLLVNDGDFYADMDGSKEVPPVQTSAFGEACMTVNPDGSIDYRLATSGLAGTDAHFHRAPAGANGPVIFSLSGGPAVWAGTTPTVPNTLLADLRGGLWYGNVHTAAHPAGEIRGQLMPASLPTPYGGACANSNGQTSQIGADGFACLGSSLDIRLYGAAASAPAVLSLGASRDQFGPLNLPFSLGFLGSPPCFLLQDLQLTVTAATDGRGCARLPLAVPLVRPLRSRTVLAQWFFVDGGVRTSNGLSMVIH